MSEHEHHAAEAPKAVHLHELPIEHLTAEIQRRKSGEVQAIREDIAGHRSAIAALEAKIAALNGGTGAKVARARSAKIDPKESDNRIMDYLKGEPSPRSSGQIYGDTGIDGSPLKASLARLQRAGKVKRHGKARATVYGVA